MTESSIELKLYGPRWAEGGSSCPPEKQAWLQAQGDEYSDTYADPRLADAARLAMLETYGLGDLYYEGLPHPGLSMDWETLTMKPIDSQPSV